MSKTSRTSVTHPLGAVDALRLRSAGHAGPGSREVARPGRPIRVLLIDSDPRYRLALRDSLERDETFGVGFEIVGESGDVRDGVALALERRPDVVIVEVSSPRLDGLDLLRRLHTIAPRPQVVALSLYRERQYEQAARRAGATRLILKSDAAVELPRVVRPSGAGVHAPRTAPSAPGRSPS